MVSMQRQQVGKCVGLSVLKVVGVVTTIFLQQQKESWSYNNTWLRDPGSQPAYYLLYEKGLLYLCIWHGLD